MRQRKETTMIKTKKRLFENLTYDELRLIRMGLWAYKTLMAQRLVKFYHEAFIPAYEEFDVFTEDNLIADLRWPEKDNNDNDLFCEIEQAISKREKEGK